MKKLTQRQLVFAKLLLAPKGEYVPVYKFIDEFEFAGKWYFLSYKGTARASEMYNDLNVIERKKVTGKSGSKYYAYRIDPELRNMGVLMRRLPEEYRTVLLKFKNYKD